MPSPTGTGSSRAPEPRSDRELVAIFSASELGGSELFNLEFLRVAHAHGCRIEAIVPADGPIVDALRPLAERVQVVPIPDAITGLSRFDRSVGVDAARAFRGLPQYRHRLNAAIEQTSGPLVCLGFRSQLACAVTPDARNRRRCWVVHEVVPNGPFGVLWAIAARAAERILTYSDVAAGQPMLRRTSPEVVAVRFELSPFIAVAAPAAPPRTLGLVGDLFALKNHLGLVDVVRRLRAQAEDVDGLLVGRDTADRETAALVRRAVVDAEGAVALRAVGPGEMPATMGEIDCLLALSTVPESFGRVCVEAMAAGRPVIGFRHGGVAEIVEDGETGILCAPGDLAAVAAAVLRLRHDPALFKRLAGTARRRAAERWSSDHGGPTIGDALVRFAQRSPNGPDLEEHLGREELGPAA